MTGIPSRHIIFSLILASLTAACNSQEEPQEQSATATMEFSAGLESRADLIGSDNITSYPFAVYSDMITMDRTPESPFIPVHDATEVRYSNDISIRGWIYDDARYWFPGFQYSFVALYPAKALNLLSDIRYLNNQLTFTYTQPLDYKDACDLLISAHRRNYAGGKTDPVGFGFTHILTNINILLAYRGPSSGPDSITVDNLTFRNIPIKSAYSIKPAQLTADTDMTSDWVNDEGSQKGWTLGARGNLTIEFSAAKPRIIKANKGAFPLFSGSDALLLLPNPANPNLPVELEINYTTDTGQKETASAITTMGWEPGSSLTLSLEIVNGKVQFSISVEEWKDGYIENTTVPRNKTVRK